MQSARNAGFKAVLMVGGLLLADASLAQAQRANPLRVATLRRYASARNGVEVPIGASPTAVVFDGDCIWMANYADNTVSKVRASDGAPLGVFPVGAQPPPRVGRLRDGHLSRRPLS